MTTAYLATPIDLHEHRETIEGLRREWTDTAIKMGFSAVYDPSKAWTLDIKAKPSESLQQVNLAALQACTALIAILPEGVPTLGVPLEIHMATSLGKPTLVVTDAKPSWTLAWFARGGSLFHQDDLEGFVHAVAKSVPPTPEEAEWDRRTQDWVARNERRREMER